MNVRRKETSFSAQKMGTTEYYKLTSSGLLVDSPVKEGPDTCPASKSVGESMSTALGLSPVIADDCLLAQKPRIQLIKLV